MVIDSSVLVAVILEEPGSEILARKMQEASIVCVGAPTIVETAMVLSRSAGTDMSAAVQRMIDQMPLVVIRFDARHAERAVDAFIRYGKGRHPAKLNYGDCLTYAIAMEANLPLLFVGNDFSKTDVKVA